MYEGLITLADPSASWVARWQRLDGYVPGVYAVKVVGMVSFVDFLWFAGKGGEGEADGLEGMDGERELTTAFGAAVTRRHPAAAGG